MYQTFMKTKARKKAPLNLPTPAEVITQAQTSPLLWAGKEPHWWGKYTDEARTRSRFPTTPELLDVITSPAGPLAVVWEADAHDVHDTEALNSGFRTRTCAYQLMSSGKTYGRVKVLSQDQDRFKAIFGDDEFTPFRWSHQEAGKDYGFTMNYETHQYNEQNLHGQDLINKRREVWLKAYVWYGEKFTAVDGSEVKPYDVRPEHIPDDETVAADVARFASVIKADMDSKLPFYTIPYVAFSRVKDELKGQGYGTGLYVYTARKLAQHNEVLRGSGLQSEEAKALWGRFKKSFPENVIPVDLTYSGLKQTAVTLDFR